MTARGVAWAQALIAVAIVALVVTIGYRQGRVAERAKLAELQAQRDAIVAQIAAQRDRVQAQADAVAAARLELRGLLNQA